MGKNLHHTNLIDHYQANSDVPIPDNQRDIDDQCHLHQEDGDGEEREEAQHPHGLHPNTIAP